MTGDKALQIVELAILRVRDRAFNEVPQDPGLIKALGSIAGEIEELQREYRAAVHGQSGATQSPAHLPPGPADD